MQPYCRNAIGCYLENKVHIVISLKKIFQFQFDFFEQLLKLEVHVSLYQTYICGTKILYKDVKTSKLLGQNIKGLKRPLKGQKRPD